MDFPPHPPAVQGGRMGGERSCAPQNPGLRASLANPGLISGIPLGFRYPNTRGCTEALTVFRYRLLHLGEMLLLKKTSGIRWICHT